MADHIPLSEVNCGLTVTVVDILGGQHMSDRLQAMGIRRGAKLTKMSNMFAKGPVVIRHGQTQTALGRGICHKILCEVT